MALIGGALAVQLALAQKPAKLPVLGILTPNPRAPDFREQWDRSPGGARLRQLGWISGETIEVERPNAEGREDRLPAIAEELVRKRVDVIWTNGPEAAVAAARATQTIPVVFWGVAWAVEQGLIDSLARPGRNVTGMAFAAGAESTKVIEALNQISPQVKRIAHIGTPSAIRTVKGEQLAGSRQYFQSAAKQLGLEFESFEVARVEDFDAAFAAILKWRAQAVVVPGTTLTSRERRRFTEFANQNRLVSCSNLREFVEAGGLFSYGIDIMPTLLQSFGYVDRVLRGAKPADLPVELPSKYELVVNKKTASALGLKIPQSVLLRADRVIE